MANTEQRIKDLMNKAISAGVEGNDEGTTCAFIAVKLMKKYGFVVVQEKELEELRRRPTARPRAQNRSRDIDDIFRSAGAGFSADDGFFTDLLRQKMREADNAARRRAAGMNTAHRPFAGEVVNGWSMLGAGRVEICDKCRKEISTGTVFWWGPTKMKCRCLMCGPGKTMDERG